MTTRMGCNFYVNIVNKRVTSAAPLNWDKEKVSVRFFYLHKYTSILEAF